MWIHVWNGGLFLGQSLNYLICALPSPRTDITTTNGSPLRPHWPGRQADTTSIQRRPLDFLPSWYWGRLRSQAVENLLLQRIPVLWLNPHPHLKLLRQMGYLDSGYWWGLWEYYWQYIQEGNKIGYFEGCNAPHFQWQGSSLMWKFLLRGINDINE